MRAARFELSARGGLVLGVVLGQRVEQAALFRLGHSFRPLQIEDRLAGRSQRGPLVGGGHVAARPVLRAGNRPAGRVEHDHETGQVLVHASQPVVHPRAQTGTAGEDPAGVHLQHGRAVDGRIGGHRVDEGDVVDAGGQVGKEIADPLAALAILLELPLRPDDATFVPLAAAAERFDRHGLAIEFVELGLVFEGIDLARPAVHEEENYALGLGRKMRRLGGQRVGELRLCRMGGPAEKAVLREQSRQRQSGEAGARLPKEFAARAAAERAGRLQRFQVLLAHGEVALAHLTLGRITLCKPCRIIAATAAIENHSQRRL